MAFVPDPARVPHYNSMCCRYLCEYPLDALKLFSREIRPVEGAEAVDELFGRAGADEYARDTAVAQYPPQRHLCERLPALGGDGVEGFDAP